MKKILWVSLMIIVFNSGYAGYGFDPMRCKNELILAGSKLDDVIKLCGNPIDRRNWGNQYLTRQYLIFKEPSGGANYYLYFENNRLIESLIQMHWEKKVRN